MARAKTKKNPWVKSIFKTLEEAHEAAKFMDLCPTEIKVNDATAEKPKIRYFTLADGTVVAQHVSKAASGVGALKADEEAQDEADTQSHPVYEKAPTRSERAQKQRTARARSKAVPDRRMIASPWQRNQRFRNFQEVVNYYNSLPGTNRAEFDVVLLVTYEGTDETYFKMTEQGLRCKSLHYPLYPLPQ